jgi:hypothetical protein
VQAETQKNGKKGLEKQSATPPPPLLPHFHQILPIAALFEMFCASDSSLTLVLRIRKKKQLHKKHTLA